MSPNLSQQINDLSLQEKILLVEEIWNNISKTASTLELSGTQKEELDKRLDSLEKNPELGRPWEEIKKDTEKP
jgi:putative addiction module component (TIGR02574 family)